jgi:sulfite reductase beta subunit-like hemoprotein/uncharacterized protein (UPF0332 family)
MTSASPSLRIAGDPTDVREELDAYASDLARFRAGSLPEPVFVEKRLRHGVYGQRQDGVHMLRSKLPLGLMTPEQLLAFADVTEVYGGGVAHLTTRQDIQIHFVPLDQTPALLRALDQGDMTSREACGNVVRNVTCAENAGVTAAEPFDPTGHALALARFLLRHPEAQSLGRKVKIHVSGDPGPRWDRGRFHDLGLVAKVRDGARGFELRVGGGLGAVPHLAPVLFDFLPEADLLAAAQAVLVVFARHGEKKNRARARIKFLVADWGLERFREAVLAAWQPVPWTGPEVWVEVPAAPPGPSEAPAPRSSAEEAWRATNVEPERVDGYRTVVVRVPRGDLSPAQLRGVAALLRDHVGSALRIGADQSLYLRSVSTARLSDVYEALVALDLALPGALGLADPVTCPGADTCKLGITSPRSVARAAQPTLDRLAQDPELAALKVRISGCPNACAQHHVADIGFFGAARTVGGVTAPHYIVMIGGEEGGAAFGTAHGKVPAARLGEAVESLARAWVAEREPGEVFGAWVRRTGRERFKVLLDAVGDLPSPEVDPAAWREPGSDEPFRIVRGTGECAGVVVDEADFFLADADREVEVAADRFAAGEDPVAAAQSAYLYAARALLVADGLRPLAPDDVVAAFRRTVYEAGQIYEGVGYYLLQAFSESTRDADRVRRLVEEVRLFVEEAHGILARRRAPAPKPRGGGEVA